MHVFLFSIIFDPKALVWYKARSVPKINTFGKKFKIPWWLISVSSSSNHLFHCSSLLLFKVSKSIFSLLFSYVSFKCTLSGFNFLFWLTFCMQLFFIILTLEFFEDWEVISKFQLKLCFFQFASKYNYVDVFLEICSVFACVFQSFANSMW